MRFGQKLRQLREVKNISQYQLAKKLGYATNSYISDVEKGAFIPSKEKLRRIAKSLQIPYSYIKGLEIEAKLEELGIREPEFIDLFRDLSKLSKKEKQKIIEVFWKIKERKKRIK